MKTYAVLYNRDDNLEGGEAHDALAAQGNLEAVPAVVAALAPLGRVVTIETGDGDPERLARALKAAAPRVVFNLAEGVRGVAALEASIPALLDLLGLPFTGNTAACLALCLDKPRTKALLRGLGVPTPAWRVVQDPLRDPLDGLRWPAIVKPAAQDASHGIEPDCVVNDEASARRRAATAIERYGPRALVEEFIDGRELNVAVVDDPPVVLPIGEIDWHLPPGVPRVVGYEAKWVEGTDGYRGTPVVCPARLDPDLLAKVHDAALRAFAGVGARDYARIDFRVDAAGQPFVLEVNPNPDLSPGAGLARSAGVAGRGYDALCRRLVEQAESRGPRAEIAQTRRR